MNIFEFNFQSMFDQILDSNEVCMNFRGLKLIEKGFKSNPYKKMKAYYSSRPPLASPYRASPSTWASGPIKRTGQGQSHGHWAVAALANPVSRRHGQVGGGG
jgi:hypothetical protein